MGGVSGLWALGSGLWYFEIQSSVFNIRHSHGLWAAGRAAGLVAITVVCLSAGPSLAVAQSSSEARDVSSDQKVQPPTSEHTQPVDIKEEARRKAGELLFITLFAVGALFLFILLATVSHRMARRIRAASVSKRTKTRFSDPWQEAGEKLQVPPDQFEE